MSLQTTLDLENWSLSDLYGSRVNQEPHISKMKIQMGGPLALVGRSSNGGSTQKDKGEKKKKKAFVVESEDEHSSEEEVGMKSMMKTLALITK